MPAAPRTVLLVDHAEAMGGAERSLLLLLSHLDRTRYTPLLACTPSPLAVEARALGIRTLVVDMPKIRRQADAPLMLLRGALALARVIRRERAVLVHSNVMRASFYAALAARLAGRPLVWHVRDIHGEGWYLRLMCRLSARAIAISRAVAAPIPCASRTSIVYNGLDLAGFESADGKRFRAELGLSPEQPLVGIVGRLVPWKGQRDFLDAAARVLQRHPEARFAVVGDALFSSEHDEAAELRRYAEGLGIVGSVRFTGHRDDVADVMAGLDLLVHCSVAEPFGRVLIEGMATRRPVVAYADGGVPEIVADGVTGLLTPPSDTQALANAIDALLDDPVRRATMGEAGRQRVAQRFTAEAIARQVEALYDDILKNQP